MSKNSKSAHLNTTKVTQTIYRKCNTIFLPVEIFNGISHSLTRACDINIRIVPVVGVVGGVDTVLIVLTVGVVEGVVVGVLAVETD